MKALQAKIEKRTKSQLIADAMVARTMKANDSARLVFALIVDQIQKLTSESEFEEIYQELTAI
jgi:hypothetical protein